MKPLQRAVYCAEDIDRVIEDIIRTYRNNPEETRRLCGLGPEAAEEDVARVTLEALRDEQKAAEVFKNDVYQVSLRRFAEKDGKSPDLVHLSIRRLDREPCRDWRDFQAIKNQLVGPECEGIELYPAESRVVDTANQYHIFVVNDPRFRFPVGFTQRAVMGPTEGTKCKQRAL